MRIAIIVTGDKDCRQLITDRVAVYNIRKNQVFDAAALRQEWGVGPDQVVDFQALVGDKVDNVPGVPGIGPKTAQPLLETYGTLDNLLEHAGEVPGAKGKKLLAVNREMALLSRELVRLDSQVPVVPDWDASRVGGMDHRGWPSCSASLASARLAERVGQARTAPTVPTASTAAEAELPARRYARPSSPSSSRELAATIDHQRRHRNDACLAAVCGDRRLLVRVRAGRGVLRAGARAGRRDACSIRPKRSKRCGRCSKIPHIRKIGQNLKYDMIVLRSVGVKLAGVAFDTMVASYLLDAGGRSHNLDDLAQKYLDHTTIKIDQLIGKGRDQKRMDEVPVAQVATYAAEDADIPLRMQPILAARLAEMQLGELNETLEVPLIEVLADMEFTGVRVDPRSGWPS